MVNRSNAADLPGDELGPEEILTNSAAQSDSDAGREAVPGREARIAYSDQAATVATIRSVVKEYAACQDATVIRWN